MSSKKVNFILNVSKKNEIKRTDFPPHTLQSALLILNGVFINLILIFTEKNKNVITLVGRSPDFDFFHRSKNQNLGVYDKEI